MLAVLDRQATAYGLIVLIAAIGLLGLLVLTGVMVAWRRFNDRHRSRRNRSTMPDLWQESGRRLVDRYDQTRTDDDVPLSPGPWAGPHQPGPDEPEQDSPDDETPPPPESPSPPEPPPGPPRRPPTPGRP